MFIDEIRLLLEAANVAEGGVNFFTGPLAAIPKGNGPYLLVRETGGLGPDKTHNQINPPAYTRPQAQVMSTGTNPGSARRMIHDAFSVLVGIANQRVGGVTRSVTLTRSGSTVTGTCEDPHGWATGYSITISGASQTEYNDDFVITVTGDYTFTFSVSGTPVTPATGTITAAYAGTWYRSIDAIQDPFSLGLDSNGNTRFAFNIRADKEFS